MIEPSSVTVSEGESNSFKCRYNGPVKWYFQDEELESSYEYCIYKVQLENSTVHVLEMQSIRLSDYGYYECITLHEKDYLLFNDYVRLHVVIQGRQWIIVMSKMIMVCH